MSIAVVLPYSLLNSKYGRLDFSIQLSNWNCQNSSSNQLISGWFNLDHLYFFIKLFCWSTIMFDTYRYCIYVTFSCDTYCRNYVGVQQNWCVVNVIHCSLMPYKVRASGSYCLVANHPLYHWCHTEPPTLHHWCHTEPPTLHHWCHTEPPIASLMPPTLSHPMYHWCHWAIQCIINATLSHPMYHWCQRAIHSVIDATLNHPLRHWCHTEPSTASWMPHLNIHCIIDAPLNHPLHHWCHTEPSTASLMPHWAIHCIIDATLSHPLHHGCHTEPPTA